MKIKKTIYPGKYIYNNKEFTLNKQIVGSSHKRKYVVGNNLYLINIELLK